MAELSLSSLLYSSNKALAVKDFVHSDNLYQENSKFTFSTTNQQVGKISVYFSTHEPVPKTDL